MIKIEIPKPDLVLSRNDQYGQTGEEEGSKAYAFTEFMQIPREKSGIFMFYNIQDELMFVGKARKLRHRIKKHFDDNVSAIKNHRDEVDKIEVCYVEDAVDREIYETYIINNLQAKYNVDKVFFK